MSPTRRCGSWAPPAVLRARSHGDLAGQGLATVLLGRDEAPARRRALHGQEPRSVPRGKNEPRSYQTSSPPVSRNFPLGPCFWSATRTISAAPSFTVC